MWFMFSVYPIKQFNNINVNVAKSACWPGFSDQLDHLCLNGRHLYFLYFLTMGILYLKNSQDLGILFV